MILPFEMVFEDQTKLGTKVQTSEYRETGAHIIVDQGQEQIAGYTDREEGIFTAVPAIIFGDHTRIIKYVDQPFFLGADGVKVLRCKMAHANYRYLYYALRHARIPDTGYNRHYKWLKEIDIEYPDASRQEEIVTILDGVYNIIAERQRQLRILEHLIKARFVEMFGDPITNSKGFETRPGIEVFKLSNGKFVPENKRFEVGIPVYGGNGISWYTDEILCANDTVVVGRVGFQSGNVHLVEGPLWISDNAMYISDLVDDQYDLRFIYAVMDHIDFTRFQDAGDLKKITQKPFMQMQYIKPPLHIQHEYVAFVSQVDKSKLSIQASLDQLETLKQSLMQKYFG